MHKNIILIGTAAVLLSSLTGCVKPYNTPMFEEIKSNETAFLVPLQGANKDSQTSFLSEEYLSKNKIAAKRITIPKDWVQTGRFSNDGRYMETMRIIKVDRTPITRQWCAPENLRRDVCLCGNYQSRCLPCLTHKCRGCSRVAYIGSV